jgi:ribosomal protein S18 acetylase RimI-like enzyme
MRLADRKVEAVFSSIPCLMLWSFQKTHHPLRPPLGLSKSMDIIEATPKDAEPIMALISGCTKDMEASGIDQWDDEYPTQEAIEADIANHSLHFLRIKDKYCGIIALDGDQPKEYEDIDWKYQTDKVLVVHRLAIDPQWQRQGIARRLMDFAEHYGQTNGYQAIRLDAFIKNPRAVKLYERRGYRKAGTVVFRKRLFYCFEKTL